MVEFLRTIWLRYKDLPLPWRVLISGLASAVAGSNILGILSEYATYSFAISQGIRPPVEGIPYLRITVTALSFMIILGTSITFSIVILYFTAVDRVFQYFYDNIGFLKGSTVSQVFSFSISILSLGVGLASISTIGSYFGEKDIEIDSYLHNIYTYMLAVSVAFIAFSRAFQKQSKPIALISALCFIVFSVSVLFNTSTYAQLLRFISYGGGLSVDLVLRYEDGEKILISGNHLIIRTSESIFTYDPNKSEIVEIPVAFVERIVMPSTNTDMWKLPE